MITFIITIKSTIIDILDNEIWVQHAPKLFSKFF